MDVGKSELNPKPIRVRIASD